MASTLEQTHQIKLTLVDSANRIIDAKDYDITYQMFSLPDDSDVMHQSFYQNSAFLKINYFIISVLDGSLVFRLDDMPLAQKFLSEYDNNFMVLPELDDITILEALHRKFSVIAGANTFVCRVSLTDQLTKVTYHLDFDPEDNVLHSLPTADEWLGELSFWEKAWWDRYDVLTFDNVAADTEERDAHRSDPSRESLTQPLDAIDDQVSELLESARKQVEGVTEDTKKPGEIISLDTVKKNSTKWKPTVV